MSQSVGTFNAPAVVSPDVTSTTYHSRRTLCVLFTEQHAQWSQVSAAVNIKFNLFMICMEQSTGSSL